MLLFLSTGNKYPLKNGIPTTHGIEMYVFDNKDVILKEFENFVQDSIYINIDIVTDDLTEYTDYDSLELGRYYTSGEIVITNQEKFIEYELDNLSKYRIRNISESNKFVKAVMIHEITHLYITQLIDRRKYNTYESDFIEEGICEYVVQKMNQSIVSKNIFIPKNKEDIKNNYEIKYQYSFYFVKNFIDSVGIKKGIIILMKNKPPNSEEIINPNLYFKRLLLM